MASSSGSAPIVMVGTPPQPGGAAGAISSSAAPSAGGRPLPSNSLLSVPAGSRLPWSMDQLALMGMSSSSQSLLAPPTGIGADPSLQAASRAGNTSSLSLSALQHRERASSLLPATIAAGAQGLSRGDISPPLPEMAADQPGPFRRVGSWPVLQPSSGPQLPSARLGAGPQNGRPFMGPRTAVRTAVLQTGITASEGHVGLGSNGLQASSHVQNCDKLPAGVVQAGGILLGAADSDRAPLDLSRRMSLVQFEADTPRQQLLDKVDSVNPIGNPETHASIFSSFMLIPSDTFKPSDTSKPSDTLPGTSQPSPVTLPHNQHSPSHNVAKISYAAIVRPDRTRDTCNIIQDVHLPSSMDTSSDTPREGGQNININFSS